MSRTAHGTQLLQVLEEALQRDRLPEPFIAERRHFDETEGESLLEEAEVVGLQPSEFASKFVACAAFAALWQFAKSSMDLLLKASAVRVTFRWAMDTMLIDCHTAKLLELVTDARGHRQRGSVFGLFSCKTPGGARLLRQSLLQPPAAKKEIEARQAAVKAFLDDNKLFGELQRLLPAIGDMDLLAARLAVEPKTRGMQWCKAAVRTALRLRHALAALPQLLEALSVPAAEGSALLGEVSTVLTEARSPRILQELDHILDSEGPPPQGGKGSMAHAALMYSVRPNVSALLDVARQTWNDAMEQVHAIHSTYAANYPEMNIRLEFTERRGWYLSHASQGAQPEFIRTAQKGTSGVFMSTTRELNSVNFKLRQAEREILSQTLNVLAGLYSALRDQASMLYRVSHAVSILDLIQAFAGYALLIGKCAQPELSDEPAAPIAIKAGRHPLMERALLPDSASGGFEPLDCFIGENCHFQAVTGRNGGGKSTYLQTVAQLVVLAQIGCWIPAQFATIRIVSSIFTRIGSTDSIEASASTFLVEMQQIAHVLRDAKPDGLVLIDELGRGTAHIDGIAICWAICERLLELKVYTLFATHFFEVCRLHAVFPGFRNMHIQPVGSGGAGEDVQAAGPGGAESSAAQRQQFAVHHMRSLGGLLGKPRLRYGICLAEQAGLPRSLVGRARGMAERVDGQLSVQLAYGPGTAAEGAARAGAPSGAVAEHGGVSKETARQLLALAERQPPDSEILAGILRHIQQTATAHLKEGTANAAAL